ncbi:hypothetical protein [Brevibacillus invocatus]|uniref:hypothetical protein n=1 Tax=Brevibacillus invocatus TaxID=173959 RepID=UPI001605B64C|nr:hypothetical protein [Brevibacillus invocatus]
MDMANCTAKLQLVFLVVLLEALVWGQSLDTLTFGVTVACQSTSLFSGSFNYRSLFGSPV